MMVMDHRFTSCRWPATSTSTSTVPATATTATFPAASGTLMLSFSKGAAQAATKLTAEKSIMLEGLCSEYNIADGIDAALHQLVFDFMRQDDGENNEDHLGNTIHG
jgi:hypothetical protein